MATLRRKAGQKDSLASLMARGFKDQVLASIDDGISVQDLDLRIIYTNDRHKDYFGEDIVGKFCYEVYARSQKPCDGCPVLQAYESGKPAQEIRKGYDKEGNPLVVEIKASPIRNEKGEIIAGVEVARDVGEQYRLQLELAEKSERLEHLQEVARDIASGLDLGKVLQQVARHAAGILAADAAMVALLDEQTGELTFPIAHNLPDNLRQVTSRAGSGVAGSVIESGEPRVDNDYQADPGRDENFAAAGVKAIATVPLMSSDRCVGAIGVMDLGGSRRFDERDLELLGTISRQAAVAIENAQLYERLSLSAQELEERVASRTEELSRLYVDSRAKSRELEKANARLKELDRLKSEFLANMSHELRTPLNSIIGFSKLIIDGLDGGINPEQRRDLEIVHESGQVLTRLVDDVLSLTKLEAGRVKLDINEEDPAALLREAATASNRLVTSKGLELEQVIPDTARPVRVDGGRIRQVLRYLIENAVKFTEEGTIRVSLEQSSGKTDYVVADTGIGLEADQIDAVFERFHQVSPGLAEKGGMGLGLAISKRLVEMHDGSIRVESRIGKGSTFTVSFPQ